MKKLLGAFLIVALTAFAGRFFFSPDSQKPAPVPAAEIMTQEATLTVATYNIHHGADQTGALRLREIGTLLQDADIVFLSEVDRRYSTRSGFADQLLLLKEYTGLSYHAYAPTLQRAGFLNLGGSYGIAVLSRYPITNAQVIYLPTSAFAEPRAALVVEVNWNGRTVRVLGTHLAVQENDRNQQLAALARLQLDLDLVLGDLNAAPKSIASLADRFQLIPANNQPTFPAENPSVQIDYIFYSSRFDLLSVHTSSYLYSDHLPVIAKLKPNYLN